MTPSPPKEVRVELVPAATTWALRQAVLRPHQEVADQRLADDDGPLTATVAAIVTDRGVVDGHAVVGTGRVAPENPPSGLAHRVVAGTTSWRLRGMAVSPDRRSQGIGGLVLGRLVDHVAGHGGGLLWCNARLPAVSFYAHAGFAVHGDPWEEPRIGPHVLMWRVVEPVRRT
jgi:GNAT superfamily N-acetyltransferase